MNDLETTQSRRFKVTLRPGGTAGRRRGFVGQRGGYEGQRGGFARQRGGFAVGLVVGVLIGLALALGVALYVTKVPIPFMDKVPQRNPGQDAAEAEKNKNWDPNAPLAGKNPAPASAGASSVAAPAVPPTLPPPVTTAPGARDPAAILADRPAVAPPPTRPFESTGSGADPFVYLVQAGAYSRAEDAEQQRARLALMGIAAKVSEREQAGRPMYRVRVGPFDKKSEADAMKKRLGGSGVEAALVRVQR